MIHSGLDTNKSSRCIVLNRLVSASSETPEGEGTTSPLKSFTIKTTPFQNTSKTAVPRPQFQPNQLPELNCTRESECPVSPGVDCAKDLSSSVLSESPMSSSNPSGELLRGILKGRNKSRFSIEGQIQLSSRRNSGDIKVTLQIEQAKSNRDRSLNRNK